MPDLLCRTGQALLWHMTCTLGGALLIAHHVPPAGRTLASAVLALVVVSPHVWHAWLDIRTTWRQSQHRSLKEAACSWLTTVRG